MWRGSDGIDLWQVLLAAVLGGIGRLMSLAHEPARGPLTWNLLWELPVAIGMGMIGRGIGDYVGLTGFPLFSASIAAAYLGPKLISWAAQKWIGVS